MAERWQLKGEYFENCNCEFLCPCLLGPRNAKGAPSARPTEGYCDVPLVFRIDSGRRSSSRRPGILDVEVEGVEGRDGTSETWLDNVKHFVSPRLAAAKATRSSFKDHNLALNNTGRDAHYSAFEWAGG